jgi:hypothetical protein
MYFILFYRAKAKKKEEKYTKTPKEPAKKEKASEVGMRENI